MNKLPKYILFTLALELDLPDILTYCRLSKRFNNAVCNNFSFWYNKLFKDFGFTYVGNKTLKDVKDYYKKIKDMDLNQRLEEAAKIGDLILVKQIVLQGAN